MTKDEALRLALEALENMAHYADTCELFLKETHPGKADALRQRVTNSIEAITAIKAALEAKDEPVAWMRTSGTGSPVVTEELLVEMPEMRWNFQQPLYTTPSQRTWLGLTDEDVKRSYRLKCMEFGHWLDERTFLIACNWAEAKLKEKNT